MVFFVDFIVDFIEIPLFALFEDNEILGILCPKSDENDTFAAVESLFTTLLIN